MLIPTSIVQPQTTADGWVSAGETWTYASADDPTYTYTIAGDLSLKYSPGMRVRVSQVTGGTKYGIITKVEHSLGTTTVTAYMGTDYDLANETISFPHYSMVKSPFGFPLDPTKWTLTLVSDTSDRAQATPSDNTWYNMGSLSGSLHIGAWDLSYHAVLDCVDGNGAPVNSYMSLSTANNSESDTSLTVFEQTQSTDAGTRVITSNGRQKMIAVTSKTTYYLIAKKVNGSPESLDFRGDLSPTRVVAVCAYL